MTPLLHHVLKDAREVRRLLVAWLGVLLAKSAIPFVPVDVRLDRGSSMLTGGASSTATIVGLAYLVLNMGFIAVTTVLVVQVVHSDSPTSASAFWLTRPIARRTMLLVKLAELVFVLCLVPVLADVIVLGAHRLPVMNIAAAAAEGWFENLLVALPVAALATLTLDVGGFALGGLSLIAAGTASLAVVLTLLGDTNSMPRTLGQSAMTAGFGAGAACAAVVTADLYLQRSRRRGLVLACAGILVFALAVRFWPVDFVGDRPVQLDIASVSPVKAGVTTAAAGLQLEIVRIDCVAGSCGVLVRENQVASLLDRSRPFRYSVDVPGPDSLVVTQVGSVFDELSHFPGNNHLRVRYLHLRLTGMLGSRPIDAHSLAAATLVRKAVTP